jgi:hypothetical protein
MAGMPANERHEQRRRPGPRLDPRTRHLIENFFAKLNNTAP